MPDAARLAVVTSHPIQYYTPFYRALSRAAGLHVHVLFGSRAGLDKVMDKGMGVELSWRTDLLGGYSHEFLPEAADNTDLRFRAFDNPSVGAVLARVHPDVVLLHGYTLKTMLRALFWCNRNKIPAMMISDSSLHAGTRQNMALAKRLFLPHLLRRFSAFLSIGDTNQAYLEHFGVPPARIFRTPNMVDEGFWAVREKRSGERAACRRALGLEESDLAILYVGKLIPRKRPADLLAALDRLAQLGPSEKSIKVLFVGDGMLRSELEAQAAAKSLPARFLGFINIDELPRIYCAADALAHPAEIETFGVIALEAAVLGLPLVLSDKVGAIGKTSIAQPGRNTLTHPCGDIDALARSLQQLANDPDLLSRLGQGSLEVSRELDWRRSVAGTVSAIAYCTGREPETIAFAGV